MITIEENNLFTQASLLEKINLTFLKNFDTN